MDWKDIARQVAGAAPMLGGMLGGPAGAAIGGLVAAAVGTERTPEAVAAALNANPDAMVRLRELEARHAERIEELAILAAKGQADAELAALRAENEDRASARNREAAVRDATPRVLAYMVTAGFFGVLGYLLHFGKPTTGGDALLVMLGALGGAWASVIAYYFGSSQGSAAKNAMLASRDDRLAALEAGAVARGVRRGR